MSKVYGDIDTPELAEFRLKFESYVKTQWTAGYECPRLGVGYLDAKVDFAFRAVAALFGHVKEKE